DGLDITRRAWYRLVMREIVPGILTWSSYSARFGYDFNGFFVRRPDGNLVVDPVEPSADDLAELTRHGVARIILTNRNHYRAAAPDELRRSLRRIADELDFDTLLVADGESLLHGARAALQRLVATFDGSAPTPTAVPRQP